MERRSGGTPAVGEQDKKVFVARAGEHRGQADENVAVVNPGIKVMTLAGRQQAEVDRRCTTAAVTSTRTIQSQGCYYPQGVYPYPGNYAPGFFTFLQGSRLTPWRDIFFRVCEKLFANFTMRNPEQDDLYMKSSTSPSFASPWCCARWLPIALRSKPTGDPKEKVGGAASVRPLDGEEEEKEWRGGLVWWRSEGATMWDGEGRYYPQVELVSPSSAFRRPWRQVGPAGRPGHLERKEGQRKGSAGGSSGGLGAEDIRRNNTTEGDKREVWAGIPSVMHSDPCCYACCYFLVPVLSGPVSSCLCGHPPPEIQEVRKARGERALWRVLTRADLSSQIEAPEKK